MLKPVDEQVNRTGADGATAWQRDLGFAHAGQKRTDDPEAGAHLGDELVRCCGVDNGAGREMHCAGIGGVLTLPASDHGNVNAVIAENALQLFDIGEMRKILQRQRIISEQRSDHQRQRRILRAGNRNDAIERISANDPDAIHAVLLILELRLW